MWADYSVALARWLSGRAQLHLGGWPRSWVRAQVSTQPFALRCLSFCSPPRAGAVLGPGGPRGPCTCIECCRIASSLSWILRSSSRPVLRQSARRRRRDEARSRHRSSVSSAEGARHRGSLPPSTPSFKHLLNVYQVLPTPARQGSRLDIHSRGTSVPVEGGRR